MVAIMDTFEEWIQAEAQHHACLLEWGMKLLELGVSWQSFRRNNEQEIIDDLVDGGIPIVAARDIVTLASEHIERTTAPMAIFWNLESIPIPTDMNGQDIVTGIKTKLSPYGSLVQFRGYSSIGLNFIPHNQRYELQLAGCQLVDCPHNGANDIVNKMIFADCMRFAYQQSDHVTICFITDEMDEFLLAELQQNRKWRTIVISNGTAPSTWDVNCDISMIWEMDIVQPMVRIMQKSVDSPESPKELIRNAMRRLSRGSGKSTFLKSEVASMLKEMDVSRFPNRKVVKSFLKKAIASGILIEHGEGPYRTLTLVEVLVDDDRNSEFIGPSFMSTPAPPSNLWEERSFGKNNCEMSMDQSDYSSDKNNFGPKEQDESSYFENAYAKPQQNVNWDDVATYVALGLNIILAIWFASRGIVKFR